jgi:wyosine [tRNA(Phe)-imidazoG37] synthetase (radical SAM superfamily)
MIAFGPVPSRRIGRSIGINNIPSKVCSYSCIYCQVGRTDQMRVERCPFYDPADIVKHVKKQVSNAQKKGESIDYLTFVPDGEPTLDVNLGREIDLLKSLGIKIGVITNGSLISREDVRNDLMKADWVSVKIDAASKKLWRMIDRPHRSLSLDSILEGMLEFSKNFHGELVTETMLVHGSYHSLVDINKTASFISALNPDKAYLSIPTRPPAENWVKSPDPTALISAYQIFDENVDHVEYLVGYEGNAFAFTGNAEKDLLSITSVHPMRESAVRELLHRANEDWSLVEKLLMENKLVETTYDHQLYYMRNLRMKEAP